MQEEYKELNQYSSLRPQTENTLGQQKLASSDIEATILSWRRLESDSKVIYYQLQMKYQQVRKWEIQFRYSQVDELRKSLKKIYSNLPSLPEKTLLKPSDKQIQQRQVLLNEFVQKLVNREDLLNSEILRVFLQLDQQVPEILFKPPTSHSDVTGFVHGVRDFVFDRQKKLLFVIGGDMNVASRVDGYMTNGKWYWESQELNKKPQISIGALECWVEQKAYGGNKSFQRGWGKGYTSQGICLAWSPSSQIIYVGLDSGSINMVKVVIQKDKILYEDRYSGKIHKERVMGLYYDQDNGNLYSIGKDKYLIQLNGINIKAKIKNESKLVSLVGQKERKRLFVGNKSGNILIYDISRDSPILVNQITSGRGGAIRGLESDLKYNYIFSASMEPGVIMASSYTTQGQEKVSKNLMSVQGRKEARCLTWNPQNGELFVGYKDGIIIIFDVYSGKEIYGFKAHNDDLTKLMWNQKENTLISSSKDKLIKFWKFDEEWRKNPEYLSQQKQLWEHMLAREDVQIYEEQEIEQKKGNMYDKIQFVQADYDQEDVQEQREELKRQGQSIESYYDDQDQ